MPTKKQLFAQKRKFLMKGRVKQMLNGARFIEDNEEYLTPREIFLITSIKKDILKLKTSYNTNTRFLEKKL